jgi:hypothetical protein
VPELLLDKHRVVAGLDQMRGVGMSQRMQAQLRRQTRPLSKRGEGPPKSVPMRSATPANTSVTTTAPPYPTVRDRRDVGFATRPNTNAEAVPALRVIAGA